MTEIEEEFIIGKNELNYITTLNSLPKKKEIILKNYDVVYELKPLDNETIYREMESLFIKAHLLFLSEDNHMTALCGLTEFTITLIDFDRPMCEQCVLVLKQKDPEAYIKFINYYIVNKVVGDGK